MTPAPDRRDPLHAYADGARDAVHAARPPEPSEAEWEAARRRIADRLHPRARPRAAAWVAVGVVLVASAAAAWFALAPVKPPATVETRPLPVPPPDPLAEFAVLPMATAADVEFRRVPGSGWFPVGADPLPAVLALATAEEVELDDPDSVWPQVAPTPGDAPMIFAAKPR